MISESKETHKAKSTGTETQEKAKSKK